MHFFLLNVSITPIRDTVGQMWEGEACYQQKPYWALFPVFQQKVSREQNRRHR